MDEEDEHSPSEFYYPEDLETFDVETETGTIECLIINNLGPIYTVRFLSHATIASLRQAYNMTYDCRSVLEHVLKCNDIFLTYTPIISRVVGLS